VYFSIFKPESECERINGYKQLANSVVSTEEENIKRKRHKKLKYEKSHIEVKRIPLDKDEIIPIMPLTEIILTSGI
jgi:hypothetical protein